ncbi:Crp/Fnr family transcriptional regulator [Sphingomonas edaphi]|uniref:Crp/Fnr family transcriptional regulator n=1 Tax=Sphingomonas edaphi TaxID=2315689 RepID=A0A418PYK8_9SPHN|nr:Crp/Fnr family transcriptional regulator [Sphingomonas edaphi]RIX27123.1 Crp/Fnr family transcriptional regulator [Sphingomonas edaphi]
MKVLKENNLLGALRPDDLALLEPHLKPWDAKVGEILYEPGDVVRLVYFPLGPSLISYRVLLADGNAVETALIGREGAVAGIVSQGDLPAYARAQVQYSGPFLRMDVQQLDAAKSRSATLAHLFARYADCVMAQLFQSIACNASHSIEQRTAKWVISAMQRTGDHVVPLTQEQLAGMLGVGRSYVSRVIRSLKEREFVETRRGSLLVRKPEALNGLACDCQRAVERHFGRVLKGVYPHSFDHTRKESHAADPVQG